MKFRRSASFSLVALITFLVSVGTTWIWFVSRRPYLEHLEDPNCVEAAEYEHSTVRCTQSKSISLCDLIGDPERYDRKIVRIRTIVVGYHHQHLYDLRCNEEVTHTWADYDSPVTTDALMKAIADLNSKGMERGNIWADIKVVGRFEVRQVGDPISWVEDPALPNAHQVRDRFRFVIMRVEEVQAVSSDIKWPN